ncbi:biotin/acetyl-CoA-carboxylase ligase [Desulfovibrio sp. X2]|nr:biotin/acetyl-CoA-carboxylase ligase [Desulfovibrio sp. X2]
MPPFSSLVAASQEQGRGQLRRGWHSPPGNLYVSLALPLLPSEAADVASLLVGLAASLALERLGAATQVKWPNDLVTHEGKVGGILVEERAGRMIAGIGMNLVHLPPASALRLGHALPPALMPGMPEGFGPLRLWLATLSGMVPILSMATAEGSTGKLLETLNERLAFKGKRVVVEDGAERVEGRLAGLAGDGGLVIERFGREGGRMTLYSGSICPIC